MIIDDQFRMFAGVRGITAGDEDLVNRPRVLYTAARQIERSHKEAVVAIRTYHCRDILADIKLGIWSSGRAWKETNSWGADKRVHVRELCGIRRPVLKNPV